MIITSDSGSFPTFRTSKKIPIGRFFPCVKVQPYLARKAQMTHHGDPLIYPPVNVYSLLLKMAQSK